ncbi:hypothetical protein PRNP1_010867 [Phytophthora ramorum]
MKSCIAFTATALIVAATINSATGLAIYLKELPNGDSFSQELGHPNKDSSQYTDFATAFAAAGHTWTTELCGATFPGSDMTNGAAFGDPCCTWKKGGIPDNTVAAFTTTSGKATVCASDSSSAGTSSTSSTTTSGSAETEGPSTDAPSTDTPSVTTEAPTTDVPSVTTEAPVTSIPGTLVPVTDPPVDSESASGDSDSSFPRRGGCQVKPHHWRHHGGEHDGEHDGDARQFRLRR